MSDQAELTAVTFNLLADFLAVPNVPPWPDRCPLVAHTLRATGADLIALQEVGPRPLADLEAALPEYAPVTVRVPLGPELRAQLVPHYGPDVWATYNEVVLFYRRASLALAAEGHWWLSPTPAVPLSTGFGNRAPRLVVWGHFTHPGSGRELLALATHFDLRAPLPMAELCARQVPGLSPGGLPLLFLGDFNAPPGSDAYNCLLAAGWRDAAVVAGPERDAYAGRPIDHILYQGLAPVAWRRILSPDPLRRWSDHDVVLACLRWA